jgi:hypothetical protein
MAPDQPPVTYPKLPPRPFASMSAEQYVEERLNQALAWYDKKAVETKTRYQWMRATTVVGGALVPVLINVTFKYVDAVTTAISILVVLLVSLESVFHFREQWVNYRSTEQFLRKEYFLFVANEGPYTGKKAKDEAYRLFVERVEAAIDAENASTLQVLTTVIDTAKPQPGPGSDAV